MEMKIEISTAKQYRLDSYYYHKMGLKKIGNKVLLNEDYPHNLPDNLTVINTLYLSDMGIESLPDNLTIKGNLNLDGNNLTSLPEDLKVGSNLSLRENNFPKGYKIPNTVEIDGEVYGL